ncbi:MAG: ABC transporter ATP-binding protein [Oscillospiraceae bacterium]|jgi:peptide/nickel transport system ATP-binding protein|nr:ABC transporter ATP-binding protein [Oscillospiraceae bacterium]
MSTTPTDNSIITVDNLTVDFPGKRAVDGVSFKLYRGELLALVGESGSGKTVLCRSLLGLPPKNAVISHDALTVPAPRDMSLVMQNAMTALDPAMTVGRQIRECDKRADVTELLARVGIDRPELRAWQYPAHLSGGMRQRAAIALALASNPKVIFADEPTTSLDAALRVKIMELLDEIRRDTNAAILFVTHDLELVRDFADRVLIMQDGKIVERGATRDIFERPRHAYTRGLLHAHEGGEHVHGASPESPKTPILELRNISKSYKMPRGNVNHVLRGVNLTINRGELLGLCGPSGIGKSTLARIAADVEKPDAGERVADKNLSVQMIFQDSVSALNPRMTVETIIAEPLRLRDRRKPPRDTILALMRDVELDAELISRRPSELSGGQRQRVAIARAIATNPDVIIADEPVSSLDVATCSKIVHLLKRIQSERGLSILLISHDVRLLGHVCDEIIDN